MVELSINQRVFVKDDPGIIRFIGQTQFASGTWIGVELQQAYGKNDGMVNDIRYFKCEKTDGNYGVFVRQTLISTDSLQKSKSIDVLNLENIINKLQDKLRNANDDIKELKKKIETLKQEVTLHQNASLSLESKLEMVTTDKEFLEESNNKVNQALEELQLKYDELKTDFQIMLEEVELNKQIEQEIISQMDRSNASEMDVQTIFLRNKLLEIALTSLQKLSTENELNLKKDIQDLNQRLALNEKEIGLHDHLLQNISAAQETIDSLQSQLDSALQLEKMIEHLNIENDSLNSKVLSLTRTVDELTELHELDKGLEENQAHVEKDLRKDIYNLSAKIKDNETVIRDFDRKNKYMELKISEFRDRSNHNTQDNEHLEELQIRLEALQLEFRKTKSSNESYKVTHDLINSKLEILQEYMSLPNATYKTILKILLLIKIAISSISVIINVVSMAIESGSSYKKSILFNVSNRFNSLKSFLQNVSALWEFNYDHKEYKSVEDKFYEMVSNLQLKVDNCATYLKDGDYEGINTSYIHDFLLETTELMDLKFFDDEEITVYFQNASCTKFLLESFRYEAKICIKIVNMFKGFLDTSNGKEEEYFPLIEQLDNILYVSLKQETEFDQNILRINDALRKGNNIRISMPHMSHFHSSLADINSIIDSLLSILAQVEAECHLNKNSVSVVALLVKNIFDVEASGSSAKFDSLLATLKRRESIMKMQIIDNQLILPGIYSLLGDDHAALEAKPAQNNAEEELKLIKPKYSGISTKLFEKEKIIQELQLNIKFLQSSMQSNSVKNKESIQSIKNELDQVKDKYEKSNQRHQELMETNQNLESEIEGLLGSSLIPECGKVFKKFADLESENQYNANMALLDEITVLRKLVKYNYSDQESRYNQNLDWLEKPLVTKSKMTNSLDIALRFERSSANLRDISKNTKLVNICDNSMLWRPRGSISKYMSSLLEEKTNNYLQQRNLTLS